MAKVKWPFMSLWASGSIGKTINCRALLNDKFVMGMHKSRSGKRHPVQIANSEIFAARMRGSKKIQELEQWELPSKLELDEEKFWEMLEYIGD